MTDEFSFLSATAAAVGVAEPLPEVRRVALTLDDGRTLSALRWGAPDRPIEMTYLHGAGLNAHTWDAVILASGRPSLALDLPGHGDSSWRDDAAYTARRIAPDVVTALREWTSVPQVLVGQSLGGLVGAAVAADADDLVRALVVVDITPGIDPSAGPAQLRAFFAGPTDWATRDELVDRAMAFGLGGSREATERGVWLNTRERPDGRVEWKHHFAHLAAAAANAPAAPTDGAPPADVVTGVLEASGWDDLAAVRAPITLVRAGRGFIGDAAAAQYAQRVPEASVVTVDSAHNVQEERPVELAGVVELAAGA